MPRPVAGPLGLMRDGKRSGRGALVRVLDPARQRGGTRDERDEEELQTGLIGARYRSRAAGQPTNRRGTDAGRKALRIRRSAARSRSRTIAGAAARPTRRSGTENAPDAGRSRTFSIPHDRGQRKRDRSGTERGPDAWKRGTKLIPHSRGAGRDRAGRKGGVRRRGRRRRRRSGRGRRWESHPARGRSSAGERPRNRSRSPSRCVRAGGRCARGDAGPG